jgi:hypothetical protein
MQHVAIDLGGKESQICVRDANEKILEERKYATKKLGAFLAKQPKSRSGSARGTVRPCTGS